MIMDQSMPLHLNLDQNELHNTDEGLSQAPRKRRRATQACHTCRRSKTRCDGRRPICRACETRGIGSSCEYAAEDGRRRRKTNAITTVRPSEDTVRDYGSPVAQLRSDVEPHGQSSEGVDGQPWSSTHPDGLATLAGANDSSLYGPSSTVDFIRSVISNEDTNATSIGSPTGNANVQCDRFISSQNLSQAMERIPLCNEGSAALPRRRSADEFVACYWDFIHPMFPVLHKATFLKRYEQFWTSEASSSLTKKNAFDVEEVVFVSTMNLVFALGCKFSSLVTSAQKATVADEFYQKSRQLFHFDVLDSASIPLVQALVLTGVHLQSTRHASRCWNTVGLAIRVAQSIGLHVDHRARVSQLEREMRRRIWYTCVNLDRLLAMTFGRPTMIDKSHDVPVPAMIDDDYLSSTIEGTQPTDIPSHLGLFVSSCTLLELLGDVLSFLSDTGNPSKNINELETSGKSGKLVIRVLDLNHRLDQFSKGVPVYLHLPEGSQSFTFSPNYVKLQQQVLYCRFLLTRLLLLRPLLLLMTGEGKSPSPYASLDGTEGLHLENEMLRRCCELCIQTAYRLIETIFDNLNTLYRSTGWHAVYFTFSAAIVLLASLKCRTLEIYPGNTSFEASWGQCLSILEHYKEQIHSAGHAIRSLKLIRYQICEKANALEREEFSRADLNDLNSVIPNGNISGSLNAESDPFGLDNISEAWFGPILSNLNWLEPLGN